MTLPLEQPAWLVFPAPISTNALFINVPGRGRALSGDYRAWKKLTAQILAAQRPLPKFVLPVEVTVYVGERGKGNGDIDNCSKAILDALTAAGIIHDDSRKWVRGCYPMWVPDMAGCVVVVAPAQPPPSAANITRMVRPGLRKLLA